MPGTAFRRAVLLLRPPAQKLAKPARIPESHEVILRASKAFKGRAMEANNLIDNINLRLVDDLKAQLAEGSRVAIAAASFSIYAFEALKEELAKVEDFRFIFTSPTFIKGGAKKEPREFFIPRLNRERNLYGSDFEIRLRNQLSQKAIARECANWIRQKAHFKSNATSSAMQGFAYVGAGKPAAYTPLSEFTTSELGLERGNSICKIIAKLSSPAAEGFLANFDNLWQNKRLLADVTDTVIEHIDTVYQENSPELIYFITLYNIFHEFLDDLSEDTLPNERTGFKDTAIWNKLYDFQKDAALAIINKLQRYNGCILADSVGLGKTFTALAVIKYYELKNQNVLVLCPKKLNDNWLDYTHNYVNNPLVKDRFSYKVLYHTDMSRREGKTNGIDLAKLNWGNYDLLVIDESHNFRNGGKPVATDEEGNELDDNPFENRYNRLMREVVQKGVKTKILMLSATPVNNGFNDLKNQLALAYEGKAEQLDRLLDTKKGIELIFRDAQKEYNKWLKLPEAERTTAALMERLSPDLFQLLDSVTIARSRRHIEQFYDMAALGKFPERLPPLSRRPKLTDLPNAVTYREIYAEISKLNLAIYTPSAFVLESRKEKYRENEYFQGQRGINLEGRERGIRKLMATNLLKRLESSVNSFRLTLESVREFIAQMVHRIDCYEGDEEPEAAPYLEDDEDEAYEESGLKIPLRDLDRVLWRQYLASDLEVFGTLLAMVGEITPEHDAKLAAIKAEIEAKVRRPFNEGNRKVLIFTAFEDTARYLYENLAPTLKTELGLESAMVSGGSAFCTHRQVKAEFSEILLNFSPISKERRPGQSARDIDILIATDCISEGQNLQDSDFLVNYDIHWNPVRIIQRFGRIDRIGSRNAKIQLVNYWPDVELDEYIQLKERVESKMKVSVMTASGDGNPLSTTEKGDLEYRRRQLKKLQEEVVNLEDMDSGLNIMDLGLNDFRQDLLEYAKTHPDLDHTPFGLSAVTETDDPAKRGVIFVLKNRNEGMNLDRQNQLHPFYMVHLGEGGSVVTDHLSPKKLLDTLRAACKGKATPNKELTRAFNKETKDGREMGRYSELLQSAVRSIVAVKNEADVDAFLKGEHTAFNNDVKGLNDFELICFLVIR